MSVPPDEAQDWSRRRWLAVTVLVVGLQLGLVFWLAARKTEKPLAPAAGPGIFLPKEQTADLPGVSDPTLFVLPNDHGFSGSAWLPIPPVNYKLEPWTEPSRPLELLIPQLGATLGEFVRSNLARPFDLAARPEPQIEIPGYLPMDDATAAQSFVTVEGSVANRPLQSALKLDTWMASEILTNSEVQIAVDAAGQVLSPVLLASCGLKTADAAALTLARTVRFQPIRWVASRPPPPAPGGLNWGKLIFHWQTVPPPSTNTGSLNK